MPLYNPVFERYVSRIILYARAFGAWVYGWPSLRIFL